MKPAWGVVASTCSGLVLATVVTLTGSLLNSSVAWLFALLYLGSGVVPSPRSGDVRMARMVGRRSGARTSE